MYKYVKLKLKDAKYKKYKTLCDNQIDYEFLYDMSTSELKSLLLSNKLTKETKRHINLAISLKAIQEMSILIGLLGVSSIIINAMNNINEANKNDTINKGTTVSKKHGKNV